MGIWALVLLTKKEVKAAFGQEETEVVIPPRIREFTVSTVKDARMAYGRGKVEVQKIIRETRPDSQETQESQVSNVAGPIKSLGMGIESFALGLVSVLILSLRFLRKVCLWFPVHIFRWRSGSNGDQEY